MQLISHKTKQIAKQAKTKEKKKSLSRMDKALTLVQTVTENEDNSFNVSSSQRNDKFYEVGLLTQNLYVCSCLDFQHRQSNNNDGGGECKHIFAVKLYIGQKEDTSKLIKQIATTATRNEQLSAGHRLTDTCLLNTNGRDANST